MRSEPDLKNAEKLPLKESDENIARMNPMEPDETEEAHAIVVVLLFSPKRAENVPCRNESGLLIFGLGSFDHGTVDDRQVTRN